LPPLCSQPDQISEGITLLKEIPHPTVRPEIGTITSTNHPTHIVLKPTPLPKTDTTTDAR